MKPVLGIRHSGMVVKDMEKALWFYRDLLGLKEISNGIEVGDYIEAVTGVRGGKLWVIKLGAGNQSVVELIHYQSAPGKERARPRLNTPGWTHVAFSVENIDETYKAFLEKGIKFTSAPYVSPDGYAKVTFCQDPEGSFIELVQVLKP